MPDSFRIFRIRSYSTANQSIRCTLLVLLVLGLAPAQAQAQAGLESYASSAVDIVGETGAGAVALGVPDYVFVNDAALGLGGTSVDVFDVGEAVELGFDVPLRNIPSQHDMIVSAYVGGLGETDNANVQVEVSSDGVNFVVVDSFETQEARMRGRDGPENDFAGVKLFFVEFGTENLVTHVRLTNTAGTAEGLRLDAVEGLHPSFDSARAFEFRIERYAPDFFDWFLVRIKNIAGPGGVPIREIKLIASPNPPARLENTEIDILSSAGDFICVENCIPNAGPGPIPFARFVWSLDGETEAPLGTGLSPGEQAATLRSKAFDVDDANYLAEMNFEITFADGQTHQFSYDFDVQQQIGSLFQKYLYFDPAPEEVGPLPTDYYQFVDDDMPDPPAVPALGGLGVSLLTVGSLGIATAALRRRRAVSRGLAD